MGIVLIITNVTQMITTMTHKICISLDEDAYQILCSLMDAHKKSQQFGTNKIKATASGVIRAGLDALAQDVLCLYKINEVMRRRWR